MVHVLKRDMPAWEFDLWCMYYQRYPFDPESCYQIPMARLAQIYVNAHLEKGAASVNLFDMLPFPRPVAPEVVEESEDGDEVDEGSLKMDALLRHSRW